MCLVCTVQMRKEEGEGQERVDEKPIILGASVISCRPDQAVFRVILVNLARHVDWKRDEAEEGRHTQEDGKAPLKPEQNSIDSMKTYFNRRVTKYLRYWTASVPARSLISSSVKVRLCTMWSWRIQARRPPWFLLLVSSLALRTRNTVMIQSHATTLVANPAGIPPNSFPMWNGSLPDPFLYSLHFIMTFLLCIT